MKALHVLPSSGFSQEVLAADVAFLPRTNIEVLNASLATALKSLRAHPLSSATRLAAARLAHSFGFDVSRFCVFTDGFFGSAAGLLSQGCVVLTDTRSLRSMTFWLNYKLSVICIADLLKVKSWARDSFCTKSCLLADALSQLTLAFKAKNIILVSGTSPTNTIRLLELAAAASLCVRFVIACGVGVANSIPAKRKLVDGTSKLQLCVTRGKIGGVAFAAALLNSLANINCVLI
ncbi:MAG: precorrin-8X methylmutase [Candidatus Hodgkinia cicadicola]